jgi:hypothetical protein
MREAAMTVKLVLAGHSHVHALGVPGKAAAGGAAIVPVKHPGADIMAVTGTRDDEYWDAFVATSATHAPAVIWAGNQHYAHFLFRPAPAVDFVLSTSPHLPLDRTAQVVPEEMIRTFFAPSFAPLAQLLDRLKCQSPFTPIVIGTPPPKGDVDRLCANVAKESVLKEIAETRGISVTPAALTDTTVVVKLWRLVQAMLEEAAIASGALFVPVPPSLVSEAGLLSDEHWASDATHANRLYGKAMLAAVIRGYATDAAATSKVPA